MLGGSAFCEVFLSKSAKPPGEVAKVGFAAWKERDLRRTSRIRKEVIYLVLLKVCAVQLYLKYLHQPLSINLKELVGRVAEIGRAHV